MADRGGFHACPLRTERTALDPPGAAPRASLPDRTAYGFAETRRTALGLVMNLGGDHLKFAFDKAELRPEDRELLSRIAGILMTATDYTISVNGHTDDVGTEEYNQKLSERRAQAVYDYLVEAGLSPEIPSVTGHGKSRPLVPGTSEEARAENRRVELGIVNTRILYGREGRELPGTAHPSLEQQTSTREGVHRPRFTGRPGPPRSGRAAASIRPGVTRERWTLATRINGRPPSRG